jgi:hypothetical protein
VVTRVFSGIHRRETDDQNRRRVAGRRADPEVEGRGRIYVTMVSSCAAAGGFEHYTTRRGIVVEVVVVRE